MLLSEMNQLPMFSRTEDPLIDVNGSFVSVFDAICSGRLMYKSDDGNLQQIILARHVINDEPLHIECVDSNVGGYEYSDTEATRRFGGKNEIRDGKENWIINRLSMLPDKQFKDFLQFALIWDKYIHMPTSVDAHDLATSVFREADIRGIEWRPPSHDFILWADGEG